MQGSHLTRMIGRLALAALAGTALLHPAGPARAAEKLTVETDWAPYGVHAALFLAAQKGWFAEAGLDVAILDGKGSATTIQQVAAGQIDIGFAQLATMAAGIDKGMPIESIACFVRAGDNGAIVPAGGTMKVAKDLVGKRIAYSPGSASASLMDAFLSKVGIGRDQLTLVAVDSHAIAGTYAAGGVDAAITTTAYMTPIVADKRPSIGITYASVGMLVPSFGLVIRKADETARAKALALFVPVTVRAWEYIFAGHVDEAVAAIVAQRPNDRLDRKVMAGQLEGYMRLFDTPATKGMGIGWQAESDWKDAIATLVEAGMIKHVTAPEAYYSNRFVSAD